MLKKNCRGILKTLQVLYICSDAANTEEWQSG
jgi:hypothetical protein